MKTSGVCIVVVVIAAVTVLMTITTVSLVVVVCLQSWRQNRALIVDARLLLEWQ